MSVKTILFCTDFSDNSLPARRAAIEQAQVFNARLIVLHVVNPVLPPYPSFIAGAPEVETMQITRHVQEGAQRELEQLVAEVRKEVSDTEGHLSEGAAPAHDIVEFAREHNADLIVLGTHGWTGIRHMILGSTAENVVRTSPIPVLTVRARQE